MEVTHVRPRSFFQRPLPTRPWCAAPLRSGELMLAVTMQSPRFLVRTLTHPMTANERTNPAGTCALMRAPMAAPLPVGPHARGEAAARDVSHEAVCVPSVSPQRELFTLGAQHHGQGPVRFAWHPQGDSTQFLSKTETNVHKHRNTRARTNTVDPHIHRAE